MTEPLTGPGWRRAIAGAGVRAGLSRVNQGVSDMASKLVRDLVVDDKRHRFVKETGGAEYALCGEEVYLPSKDADAPVCKKCQARDKALRVLPPL